MTRDQITRKINHPLWVHLPAIGLFVYVCVRVAQAMPLPDRVATHFGFSGLPDAWGSPWAAIGIVLAIMAGYIVLWAFLSEIWSRQEHHKTFNWLSPIDDGILAAIAVTFSHWLDLTRQPEPLWQTPWWTLLGVVAAAVAMAAGLELLRPFRPFPRADHVEDVSDLEQAVAARMMEGKSWTYWEIQNPAYANVLSVLLILISTTVSVLTMWSTSSVFPGVLILILAAIGVISYGGMHVQVAQRQLFVRMGTLGLRLVRMPLAQIAAVDVQQFSPMRDFGGWGGRLGFPDWAMEGGKKRAVRAFYLRGTRGVKITRTNGRIYLIGSDSPDRLCAVLRGAMKQPAGSS